MSQTPQQQASDRLDPEKVAYWYFRLNGFLQIENFVVHPSGHGGQRTDADLLAVRFPYRAERLFDNPNDIMVDDEYNLMLSRDLIDVVIVEVKTNSPCTLNGPWTRQDRQNVHRVLAAIGCLPHDRINDAATDIYRTGQYQTFEGLRIRLLALGRDRNTELAENYPSVTQLIWTDLLTFIWHRFRAYRNQKKQVGQWDATGLRIKRLANGSHDPETFVTEALTCMNVRQSDNPTWRA